MKNGIISGVVIILLLVFFIQPIYAQKEGMELIDSLNAALLKLPDDTNKVKTLAQISLELSDRDIEKGLIAGKRALKLSEDLHYGKGIAISRLSLAYNYFYRQSYDQVLENLLRAEPIFVKLNDADGLCAYYCVLTATYAKVDSLKSREYYFKAKSLFSHNKIDTWKIRNLSWILEMSYSKEPDSTYQLLMRFKKLVISLNNTSGLATFYFKMTGIYYRQKNDDSAFYYHNLTFPLILKLKHQRYLVADHFYSAVMVLRYNKMNPDNLNKFQEAERYINLSISAALEYGSYQQMANNYLALSGIQKSMGHTKDALRSLYHHIYYYKLNNPEINFNKAIVQNYVYEKELKKKELELLIRDNDRQRNIIMIGTAGIIILLIIITLVIIIRRKNQQLKRMETESQMVTLEQKALQSMMNPHFIFNALGSIQTFLLQNKPDEAGLFLSQFARLIRQNLSAVNSAMIDLEEEIDRLKNYLDLERLRMENKFEYTIEIDEGVEEEEMMIPSMIIQPFVENAIWHGIAALKEKGMIRIYFTMNSSQSVKITIEDNGVGMKKADTYSSKSENHLHMGMAMTQKRLEIIGRKMNTETSVVTSEAIPGSINPGTRVVIIVPISYSNAEV